MSSEEYDNLVEVLTCAPEANCVVCRSREEALALLAWIEENCPDD
jgi:hypothetical protein